MPSIYEKKSIYDEPKKSIYDDDVLDMPPAGFEPDVPTMVQTIPEKKEPIPRPQFITTSRDIRPVSENRRKLVDKMLFGKADIVTRASVAKELLASLDKPESDSTARMDNKLMLSSLFDIPINDILPLKQDAIKQYFGKHLEKISKLPTLWQNTKKAWDIGGRQVDLDFQWRDVKYGRMTREEAEKKEAEFNKMLEDNPLEARNWLENVYLKTIGIAHPMASGQVKGLTYGLIGAGAGAAVIPAPDPLDPITIPTGFGIGHMWGALSYWTEQGEGSIYKEALKSGLTHKTSALVSSIGGPLYGAIEFSQVDKLIPGLGRIGKSTVLSAITGYLKRIGVEVLEEGEQKLITEGATRLLGQALEKKITLSDVPKELKDMGLSALKEMKEALGPMTILAMPGGAIDVGKAVIAREKDWIAPKHKIEAYKKEVEKKAFAKIDKVKRTKAEVAELDKQLVEIPAEEAIAEPEPTPAAEEPAEAARLPKEAEITPPAKAAEAEKAAKPLPPKEVTAKKIQKPTPAKPEGEVEEGQITEGKRRALIKQTVKEIRENEIYQIEADAHEVQAREIGPGYFYADPKYRSEIEAAAQGDKKVLSMFTYTDKKATSWDKAVQEMLGKGKEGVDETWGEMDISEFVERLRIAVEGEGVISEKLLNSAVESGQPDIELLALKYDALQSKLTPDEINDTIEQWAQDNPDVDRELVDSQLIKITEAEYVKAKQEVLRRLEKEGERKETKKAKERITPEQAAVIKARTVARKLKAPAYIYEKQGRFFVSKNPPLRGPYKKVSPPSKDEVTQKITEEVRTQKDQAVDIAKTAAKKSNTDYFVWKNPQGRFIATKKEPLVGDYTKVNPQGEVSLVRGLEQATDEQKSRVNELAKEKGLINEKGKPTPRYRKFAKVVTGKTTIDTMTKEEAEDLADMLDLLTVDYRGKARIPSPMDIINKELLTELKTKVPELRNIGFLERFRPSWRVYRKMGLFKEVFEPAFEAEISSMEELFGFREQSKKMQKLVGKDKISAKRLFNAIENPGSVKHISDNEKVVIQWAKKNFDDWADRFNLTPEQRRKNYITHIFEKDIAEQLKEKHPIDPDLIRALDFITPQTIFNPFLQERLGKTTGLKRDLWAAIEAYENRALKKFYYEPLIKRIRVYEKFLPPTSARYLRNYITRITSRPLVIDKEVNQTLKEAAEQISKLPGGKRMAQYLTKGNASGLLAYNLAGVYYESWLGLRPASAIKNLSQHGLAMAETGPVAFSRAMKTIGKERARLLANSKVLRSRQSGYLPGIDQTYIKSLESKRRKITMAMFRAADRKNVSDAFLSGYHEAKAKGLPDEWAYKRGDEVARKTQYLYTKLSGPQASQSGIGRVLSILTTWPENWAELMNDWIQAKPSEVYQDYAKETGKTLKPTNWASRRKALWTYLGLVGTAKLIEKGTPIKAMYYTGWTSLKSIKDIASGKLPGLEIPATIALLVAGLMLGDKRLLKQAWNKMKNFIVIARELRDIVSGKKDWMNLFIYTEKKKEKEPWKEAEE